MDEVIEYLFILYYAIAIIGIIGSSLVLLGIYNFGSIRAKTTQCVIYLHVSILLEEISTFPRIYRSNSAICQISAFLHLYSGLANIISVFLLVLNYRLFFYPTYLSFIRVFNNHSSALVVLFPLITVLPFITSSYYDSKDSRADWCTFPNDGLEANIWSVAVFYAWAWLLLLASLYIMFLTFYQVYIYDSLMANKLLSTVGIYIIVSVICWIPRTIERIIHFITSEDPTNLVQLISFVPIYICGIIFCCLFYSEMNSLKAYEANQPSDDTITLDADNKPRFSFSWEDLGTPDWGERLLRDYTRNGNLSDIGDTNTCLLRNSDLEEPE